MDIFKNRRFIVLAIFASMFLIFGIKLFYIQLVDDKYEALANQNVIRNVTVYPNRGLVFDRNGVLIVENDATYEIFVIPRQVKALDTLLFCQLLDLDPQYFKDQLAKARQYSSYVPSSFLKNISVEQYAAFQEHLYMFPGFYGDIRLVRKYPHSAAAHLLGYTGEISPKLLESQTYYKPGDYIGISGLEATYEDFLRGQKGSKLMLVDKFNREQGSFQNGLYDTAAVSGHNLTITIDMELQAYGEKLMQNKKGCIVAIEPTTGQILAMISSPSYDPNLLTGRQRGNNYVKLQKDTLKPLFNRAVSGGSYPPGSTFKSLMALVGLQEGTLKVSDAYPCNGGYRLGAHTVGCHAHPPLRDLTAAIQYSCNSYFCYVFKNVIDQDKFATSDEALTMWNNYLYSFGLGNKLGVDIPGENTGLVPTPKYYNKVYTQGHWKSSTIISLAIGQGELGLTPLQMANMTASIANRGFYYTPHFVKIIEADTTNYLERYSQKHQTKVEQRYFDVVVEGLYQTVEQGTGRIAKIDGYEVCGKTGTVENPHGEDHSAFIAFAPKTDPKIVITVFVENSGFGATYAAPIATLMMEKYLNDTIATKRLYLEKRMVEKDLIHPKVATVNATP
ncbi:penicillin-binding protein 2 [soil metagenome]